MGSEHGEHLPVFKRAISGTRRLARWLWTDFFGPDNQATAPNPIQRVGNLQGRLGVEGAKQVLMTRHTIVNDEPLGRVLARPTQGSQLYDQISAAIPDRR